MEQSISIVAGEVITDILFSNLWRGWGGYSSQQLCHTSLTWLLVTLPDSATSITQVRWQILVRMLSGGQAKVGGFVPQGKVWMLSEITETVQRKAELEKCKKTMDFYRSLCRHLLFLPVQSSFISKTRHILVYRNLWWSHYSCPPSFSSSRHVLWIHVKPLQLSPLILL